MIRRYLPVWRRIRNVRGLGGTSLLTFRRVRLRLSIPILNYENLNRLCIFLGVGNSEGMHYSSYMIVAYKR